MQIGILEPEGFPDEGLDILKTLGTVYLYGTQSLEQFIVDKDILFIRLGRMIDKVFLEKCQALKYICTATTGLTHVDIESATAQGINVLSLRGEKEFLRNIRATPEHIFGLTIALLRNYSSCFSIRTEDKWNRNLYRGEEIYRNRVGIIGMGRIGRLLDMYFNAFGAEVRFVDPDLTALPDSDSVRMNSIGELISWSRIVILCASYSPEIGRILSLSDIEGLSGRYFINAARGELVDEEALYKMISSGRLLGAALDVLSDENLTSSNWSRFMDLTEGRNLLLTPHIGGATYTSMAATESFICKKLASALSPAPE